MKTAGFCSSGLNRIVLKFFILFLLILGIAAGSAALFERYLASDQLKRVRRSEAWIQSAFDELQKTPPPKGGPGFGKDYLPVWTSDSYLIFTNGWAAYKYHSFHANDGLYDFTVMRLSDGRFFISKRHFCTGMINEMAGRATNDLTQPLDANEFLNTYARNLELTEFSLDQKLKCAVICPEGSHSLHSKKSLWVWISDGSQKTLLERGYPIKGSYVACVTHWVSPDEVTVDIVDWRRFEPPEESFPSQPIIKLSFHRDKQTGLFAGPE